MRIYFVTGNRHKFEEASRVLESFLPKGLVEFHPVYLEKLEIQSDRLDKIALFSARHAYGIVRHPLVVEDTGLFIDALRGFPGPYSSFVNKTIGPQGILKLMEGMGDRRARFMTAVAAIIPPYERVFMGEVRGTITDSMRGSQGFGFDPIFIPEGSKKTFAEMNLVEKNSYSHRARAFSKLAEWLKNLLHSQRQPVRH